MEVKELIRTLKTQEEVARSDLIMWVKIKGIKDIRFANDLKIDVEPDDDNFWRFTLWIEWEINALNKIKDLFNKREMTWKDEFLDELREMLNE